MNRYLRLAVALLAFFAFFAVFAVFASAQEPELSPSEETYQIFLALVGAPDSYSPDVIAYAEMFSVNLEETKRRLALQDTIGDLNYQLNTNEAETFAGLWIQHTPTFKVIVKFVGDGEKTIQPYIENNPLESLIEIHPATVSLASLVTEQETAIVLVRDIDVRVDSGIDIKQGVVELYVIEREKFDAELQRLDIQLPAHVEIITVEQLAQPG